MISADQNKELDGTRKGAFTGVSHTPPRIRDGNLHRASGRSQKRRRWDLVVGCRLSTTGTRSCCLQTRLRRFSYARQSLRCRLPLRRRRSNRSGRCRPCQWHTYGG